MHVCGTHVSLVFQISIIVILRLSTLILEKKSSFFFLSRDWVVITSFEEPSLALPSGWFLESAVMGKAKEGNKAETLSLCQHELFMSQVLPKKGFWGRLKFLDTQDHKVPFHFAIKIHSTHHCLWGGGELLWAPKQLHTWKISSVLLVFNPSWTSYSQQF